MAKYQVSIIERPAQWQPPQPDAVPAEPGKPLRSLADHDSLFAAVRQAIEFNQEQRRESDRHWAVVVEPGAHGRTWRNARLCTPLRYRVVGIWWPGGWEPASPLDVPNCVWRAQGESEGQPTTYARALAIVRGLNQQSMDRASPLWYVIVAVENEPLSQTVSFDPAGTETTVQVRKLHVIRPDEGGRGDCSHCPAAGFECAREDWISLEQTQTTSHSQDGIPGFQPVRSS